MDSALALWTLLLSRISPSLSVSLRLSTLCTRTHAYAGPMHTTHTVAVRARTLSRGHGWQAGLLATIDLDNATNSHTNRLARKVPTAEAEGHRQASIGQKKARTASLLTGDARECIHALWFSSRGAGRASGCGTGCSPVISSARPM